MPCVENRLILLNKEYVNCKKNEFIIVKNDNNFNLNDPDYGNNFNDAYGNNSNERIVLFRSAYQLVRSDNVNVVEDQKHDKNNNDKSFYGNKYVDCIDSYGYIDNTICQTI